MRCGSTLSTRFGAACPVWSCVRLVPSRREVDATYAVEAAQTEKETSAVYRGVLQMCVDTNYMEEAFLFLSPLFSFFPFATFPADEPERVRWRRSLSAFHPGDGAVETRVGSERGFGHPSPSIRPHQEALPDVLPRKGTAVDR